MPFLLGNGCFGIWVRCLKVVTEWVERLYIKEINENVYMVHEILMKIGLEIRCTC